MISFNTDCCYRRQTRILNFDPQVRNGRITYSRVYSRVGSMGRFIDLDCMDGRENAAKVADLRRTRSARARNTDRRLAV